MARARVPSRLNAMNAGRPRSGTASSSSTCWTGNAYT
jgi:hypothetical protein